MHIPDMRSQIIIVMLSFLVPYSLVAWAFIAMTNGKANDFWVALGVLFALRAFFGIVETLGGILHWHLYGKRMVVDKYVEFLRTHGFPKRNSTHDGLLAYLVRIEDDQEQSASMRTAATYMHTVLSACEEVGILPGSRMHSAMKAALEIYSPKAQAPA